MNGEGARVVINQSAPTLCIQVPIFEAIAASQIARNNELDSGCQADAGALGFGLLIFGEGWPSLLCATASWLDI